MGKDNLFRSTLRTYLQTILLLKTIIFAAILITGCEEMIVVGGAEPTINFQEGTIEGVKTGDDTTTVIQKLGRPDWIGWGDFDGFSFMYKSENQLGREKLDVGFVNLHNYDSLIAPYTYLVFGISATELYKGKSKEGIGIGTQKQIVRYFLGTPSKYSDSTNDWFMIDLTRGSKVVKHFYIISYSIEGRVDRIVFIRNYFKNI